MKTTHPLVLLLARFALICLTLNIHILIITNPSSFSSSSAVALQLPLPGGRSIKYNPTTGVLRIDLSPASQRAPPIVNAIPHSRRGGNNSNNTLLSLSTLSSITVRDTGTKKGYGAFATANIPRGTFLGFYEGDIIVTRETLDEVMRQRQKTKQEHDNASCGWNDYVLSLDGGVTFLDGYDRAMNRSVFTPAHLNHEDGGTEGCNCLRYLGEDDESVAFFTSRDVHAGEELCFDYGRNFWVGRENQKIQSLPSR